MNIVLMGAQGSGKGTACEQLLEDFDFVHISVGDLFRLNIKNGTAVGKLAESYMNKGMLVPDDVTIKMLKERLAQDDCKNGVLFDGFPRNLKQAELLDEICDIDLVIYLNASYDVSMRRLTTRRVCTSCKSIFNVIRDNLTDDVCRKCGGKIVQRDDDTEDAIKKRLDIYKTETEPVLHEYEKRGLVVEIDADQEQKISYDKIKRVINEKI